jgi:hypothetical protein
MSTTTKRAKRATIFGAALPILIIFVSGCALIALLATANLDNQAGVTEEARAATDEPTFMPSDTPRPTATRVPHPTNTPQIDAAGQPTTGAPQATQPSTATETATPATLSTVGGESPTEISFTQAPATEISFTQVPATEISYTQVPASPGLPYSGHISNVGSYLNTIYMHGQQLGNNPRAFSKIGDCEAAFRISIRATMIWSIINILEWFWATSPDRLCTLVRRQMAGCLRQLCSIPSGPIPTSVIPGKLHWPVSTGHIDPVLP